MIRSAENQPKHEDDGDRHADQPQQNTFAHRLIPPSLLPSERPSDQGSSVRVTFTSWDERRHEFRQASGRWQMCDGEKYCRECNREAVRRDAMRRAI